MPAESPSIPGEPSPRRPGARSLLLLALVALCARLLAGSALGPERLESSGYVYYGEMADNLLAGEGLHRTMPFGHGDRFAIRTPGYPLLLAGLELLPGDLAGKVALCGALFGTASVVLLALIVARAFGAHDFGARAGLLAGGMLALWPSAVVHDGAMQDTALYSMLLLAALLLTMHAASTLPLPRLLALSVAWGVVASAGILVRVTLVLPLAAFAAWWALRSAAPASRRLVALGLALSVMLAGLAPWLARNARVVGAPVLTSDTGRSLWLGHNPETFSVYPRQSIDRAEERAWAALSPEQRAHVLSLSRDELAQDAWFKAEALRHAREHPLATLAGGIRKLGATFSPWMSPRAAPVKQAVHFVSWSAALVLGAIGAWSVRRRMLELAPLWMPVALLALHSAIFFGHSSYRAYVDALVLAFAALPLASRLPGTARSAWRLPFLVGLAALGARLALVLVSGELRLPQQEWERGWELGAVARSMAEGKGFANPFLFETGPTAAVGPGVPLLLALPFRALGPDSGESWRLMVLLNVLASALVAPALLLLGASAGLQRAGRMAALAWCVEPVALLSVRAWQGHAFVLLATLGIAAVLRLDAALREGGRFARALVAAGLVVGAGLWFEPMLLPPLVAWAAFVAWREDSRRRALAPLAMLALAGVVIAPWVARNAVVVGTASIRSWAGPELYLGAVAGPFEPTPVALTPLRSEVERTELQSRGEAAYVRSKLDAARDLVVARPGRWLRSCASRVVVFWFGRLSWWEASGDHPVIPGAASALRGIRQGGLALLAIAGLLRMRRSVRGLSVIVAVLALFPLTYALTHVEARYRLPLEPLLLLLAVAAILPRDRAA